jgi:hypothetical protein
MNQALENVVEHLKWLNFWIGHCCDQAEAKVGEINRLIQQLAGMGLVRETVLLGEVIPQRYGGPVPGGPASGQLVQAALCVPGGVGVVRWDAEADAPWCPLPAGQEAKARVNFRPYAGCEPALKTLLLRHIEPLLQSLWRRLS